MRRRSVSLALAISCLSFGPLLADDFDGIILSIVHGPQPEEVTLQWSGGQPDFTIYRSTDKTSVLEPGNQIGISTLRSWIDSPTPGNAIFYKVTSPCVYAPPEVCDNRDNDCNGQVDDNPTDAWLGQTCCPTGNLADCQNTGTGTRCHTGVYACSLGAQVCSGAVAKSVEFCNGLDDDCDGERDEVGSEAFCELANASPACSAGACVVASCNVGYGDCNGTAADGCEINTHPAQSTSPATIWANDPDPDKDLNPGYARVTNITNCGACGVTCDDGVDCTTDLCVPVGPSGAAVGVCRHYDRGQCSGARCGGLPLAPGTPTPEDAACTALDSDGDGLSDPWESSQTNPYTADPMQPGIDLDCDGEISDSDQDFVYSDPPIGPLGKDVYIAWDYMAPSTAAGQEETQSHAPPPEAVDAVIASFAAQGITLHVDPVHHVLPHSAVAYFPVAGPDACAAGDAVSFQALKAANFEQKKKYTHKYVVFAHDSCYAGASETGTTGIAEERGDDAIVSLGSLEYSGTAPQIAEKKKREQAGTIMHELGHTWGLDHGGPHEPCVPSPCPGDAFIKKPNYLSSMNYRYQLSGIQRALTPGTTLPFDTALPWRVDYSSDIRATLNESDLNETAGLSGAPPPRDRDIAFYSCLGLGPYLAPGQGPVDWNCDGLDSPSAVSDVNNDGVLSILNGADDWGRLDYRFQCRPTFADGAPLPGDVTPAELTVAQANAGRLRATLFCQSDAECDDGSFCNGVETCSPATGGCQPGTVPSCDDFNPCTVDSCNQANNGCLHDDAAANGLSCSLPNAIARCAGGACAVVSCDAGYGDCNVGPADGCETSTHLAQSTSPATIWANDPNHDKDLKPGYARVTGITNCGACGVTCDDGVACTTDLCVPVGPAGGTVGVCRHFDRGRCSEARCGGLPLAPGTPAPGDPACTAPDSDGDGLNDPWETPQTDPYSGSNSVAGVDLDCDGEISGADGDLIWHEAPSAPDKNKKDIYLEYDYMEAAPGELSSHAPSPDAIAEVVSAFASRGIALHVDPVHQVLPHADVLYLPVQGGADACAIPGNTSLYDIKNNPANFDLRRKIGYRYAVFGHSSCSASSQSGADGSGGAEIGGNDMAVTLGTFTYAGTTAQITAKKLQEEAGTLMHEIGHSLGLDHGGAQPGPIQKPNYISSMNYSYQLASILRAATPGTTSPLDPALPRRVDFSPVALDTLDESALDENLGVNSSTPPYDRDIVRYYCAARPGRPIPGPAQGPVDWDCDGTFSPRVSQDLNNNGVPEVLPGVDDWAQLDYRFQCQPTFADGPQDPSRVARDELTSAQATTLGVRAGPTAYCDPGFDDCDGVESNGCETPVDGDSNNCGGCGIVCATGSACVGGACTAGPSACSGSPNSLWAATTGPGAASAPTNDTGFNPSGGSSSFFAQGPTVYKFYNITTGTHPAGSLEWSRTFLSTVMGSPVPVLLKSGVEAVFVAGTDGFLYRLDPATGANAPGFLPFDTRRSSCPSDQIASTPAVQLYNFSNADFKGAQNDDLVFVITRHQCGDTSGNKVFALRAGDGSVAWTFDPITQGIGGMNYGNEACALDYAANRLYCGTDQAGLQKTLWAINTTDGTHKWSTNAGGIVNRPVLKGTRLYVATTSGVLRARNAGDGLSIWSLAVGLAPIVRNPSVVSGGAYDGLVLVTDANGILTAIFDAGTSGQLRWSIGGPLPVNPTVTTMAVVAPSTGKAWIGRSDGTLQQINLADGSGEALATVGFGSVNDPSLDTEGGASEFNRLMASVGGQVKRYCVPWTPGTIGTSSLEPLPADERSRVRAGF